MRDEKKTNSRPPRFPSQGRHRRGRCRRDAGNALDHAAQADSETNDEKRKARYKETDHVKAYYRVNRYPR